MVLFFVVEKAAAALYRYCYHCSRHNERDSFETQNRSVILAYSTESDSHEQCQKSDQAATAIAYKREASIYSAVALLELYSSGAVGVSEKHLLVPVLLDLPGSAV